MSLSITFSDFFRFLAVGNRARLVFCRGRFERRRSPENCRGCGGGTFLFQWAYILFAAVSICRPIQTAFPRGAGLERPLSWRNKSRFYCAFPPVLISERWWWGREMEGDNEIAEKSKRSVWIRLLDLSLETFAPKT